jgi:hypothetical protein
MLTIAQIAERYGLTERQVRWRLTQLDGLLRHHLFTGVNGRVTLDDAGVAIFDRLLQLEREGLGLTSAVKRLSGELGQGAMGTTETPHGSGASTLVTGETGDSVTLWERLLAEKDARIADLQAERDRLLRLLEDLQARLPALPPSSSLNITRWQALKIALLGRS